MSLSMRDTVHQSIGRSNRNTAILSIIAILIGVAGFVGAAGKSISIPDSDITFTPTSRYILRHFGQPQVMNQEQLEAVTAADLPLYNVVIEGDEMFDSGMYEETTTTRRGVSTGTSITAYFGILTVGDRFLLTKHPGVIQESITKYTGAVVAPAADEVGKQVYADLLVEVPEIEEDVLPLLFDTGYEATPWFIGAAVEAVLVLGGLFGLATVASRRNPDNHPIIKRMARFGDVGTVMSQIDGEMASGQVTQVDKIQFTRNWIIYKSGNDMHFARISDVMWAYKHVTQNRYGKTYAAYVWDRSGEMLNVVSSEKNVDAMIMAVLQRAPWAIAGYNKDVEKSWKNDRAGFIRTVDDRRKQMTTPQ
jgi:hypothetical protein